MGLAQGADGSLYISDSRKGTIWRVIYTGEDPVAEEAKAEAAPGPQSMADHPGRKVYNMACLPCHQADGNGVPGMHPPIRESEWVTGDKERLIRIVWEGMEGEIVVHGETYNSVMAPLNYLEPQQVADVLTYVRNSFGNQASEVTLAEVQEVLNNL